jgi:hypothetical protein
VVVTGAEEVGGTPSCGGVLGAAATVVVVVVVVAVEVVEIDVAAVVEFGLVVGPAEVSTSADESARCTGKAAMAVMTTSPASATPIHGHAYSQTECRVGSLPGSPG